MKGPEDQTVLAEDNGNDPLGLVYRWVLPTSSAYEWAASLLRLSSS